MNALAIRNLCLHLAEKGQIIRHEQVGVCTPYSAQAKILKRLIISSNLEKYVDSGTVHRYQGDEKTLMILDIPDSYGERTVSVFLEADSLSDVGSRLINVAISRAENQLVVFANLAYLDQKLPKHAFLRGILSDMAGRGLVTDVRKILSLWPITKELLNYHRGIELSDETLKNNLFNERDFQKICLADIKNAKKNILIFSGFVTPQRVAEYESIFRAKTSEGVIIRCVTRPPFNNGTIDFAEGKAALDGLEAMGCIVDTRGYLHQKTVIIDSEIVWNGSLNPLSYTLATKEVMARFVSKEGALQFASFLAIDGGSHKDDVEGLIIKSENPRCHECGGRCAYMVGKYGAYWKCENCCWKMNYDQLKRPQKTITLDTEKAPCCPKCGAKTIPRVGRFGEFYSCSKFPDCNGKVSSKFKTDNKKYKKKIAHNPAT